MPGPRARRSQGLQEALQDSRTARERLLERWRGGPPPRHSPPREYNPLPLHAHLYQDLAYYGNVTIPLTYITTAGNYTVAGNYTTLPWTATTTGSLTMPVGYGTQIWNTWYTGGPVMNYVRQEVVFTPEQLEAQRLERARLNQIDLERRQAQTQRVTAARVRATELLRMIVTDAQWEEHQREGKITVQGSSGRWFEINTGTMAANVWVLDERGNKAALVCAHPEMWTHNGSLPTLDGVAGQLLHITTDDIEFLRRANVHRGVIPPVPLALAA